MTSEQTKDISVDKGKEDRMSEDNTKPEFFALWSVRQLQVECAKLNQLLRECIEIAEKGLQK